jgi:streptomycin 6-kinase
MLDVQFISNILVDIWQTPLQHYSGDHLGLMDYWLKDKNQDFPPELKAAELWSQQLVAQAAQEPTTHIHGDIGFHNLLITDDQQYLFLDPSGVSGPRSWDIGCLAAWSGSPKREAVKKAVYIADLVDVDQTESARWAIVRTIASSALGHRRQNYQQRDDCLQSLPELKNDFEELRSN